MGVEDEHLMPALAQGMGGAHAGQTGSDNDHILLGQDCLSLRAA